MSLTKIFGANWRTTLSAMITAIAGFIATNPEFVHNDFVVKVAQYICLGGLTALGINARDKQTGTRPPGY